MSRQARTQEGCQSLLVGPSLAPLRGAPAREGRLTGGIAAFNPRLISSIPPGWRGRGQGDFHSTENVKEPYLEPPHVGCYEEGTFQTPSQTRPERQAGFQPDSLRGIPGVVTPGMPRKLFGWKPACLSGRV